MNLCLYTHYLSLGQVGSFYIKIYFFENYKKRMSLLRFIDHSTSNPSNIRRKTEFNGPLILWTLETYSQPVCLSTRSLPQLHYTLAAKDFFPSGESHCMIISFEQSMFVWNVSRLYCPHCSLKLSSEGCNGDKHKALEHKILPSLSRPGSMAYVARVRTTGSLITSSSQEHRRMQLWLAEWVFNSSIYWKVHFGIALQKVPLILFKTDLGGTGAEVSSSNLFQLPQRSSRCAVIVCLEYCESQSQNLSFNSKIHRDSVTV